MVKHVEICPVCGAAAKTLRKHIAYAANVKKDQAHIDYKNQGGKAPEKTQAKQAEKTPEPENKVKAGLTIIEIDLKPQADKLMTEEQKTSAAAGAGANADTQKVYKCGNCGATYNSRVSKCTSCGIEFE